MKIFNVIVGTQYIGMRIEGFQITTTFFKNKKKALDFAFNKASNYAESHDKIDKDNELLYNDSGDYEWKDSSYEWKEFYVSVEEVDLALDEDVICTLEYSDY
jgi:hypothetical protein